MRHVAVLLLMLAPLLLAPAAEAGRGARPRPPGGDMRSEARVVVGDALPDLELVAPDGAAARLRDALKEARPLVLIFGSFT